MPPRRKTSSSSSSSSKKSNLQSQPSKFGIQHFFDRHTQNSQKDQNQNPPSSKVDSTTISKPHKHSLNLKASNAAPNCLKTDLKTSVVLNVDEGVENNSKVPNLEGSTSRNYASNMEEDRYGGVTGSNRSNQKNGVNSAAVVILDEGFEENNRMRNSVGSTSNTAGSVELPEDGKARRSGNPNDKSNPQATVSDNPPQITPSDDLMQMGVVGEGVLAEPSPEITKFMPRKRFKFSPGMLIKQSQDDGGDEVTWKISPVNERLQAVSKKMPEVVKLLADSSRVNASYIQHCSIDKISMDTTGNVDKWNSSPMLKTSGKCLGSANKLSLKRVNPDQNYDSHVRANEMSNSISTLRSPFRTPPSLSYCHDKLADDIVSNSESACDHLGLRQHKKALLELLDQVEDVITVEEPPSGTEVHSSEVEIGITNEMTAKFSPIIRKVESDPTTKVKKIFSSFSFLALEVSEKFESAKSSAPQCPYKVLRLLNEKTGEERAVYLWEEWFYSVVAPGDTVNIIGEFDNHGNCHVDREKNLLIVHPDILVSGTRVAASFSCPRRTVLDERLRCAEHSTAALIGTLLHQIFQAGLVKDNPTKDFLEEYARTVLVKNIEDLYACGVNEIEMHKLLIEAIPKLLNWIYLFKDSKDSNAPSVDFGSDQGQKKVHISEVIDIEEMAWAPKYGLKGMIDASLGVKVGYNTNEAEEKIVPLEFKTGKGPNNQVSMEHRAQVILYTLLMSERYLKHIDSGLLYYLQTDQTQGIAVQRSDLIGLVMRRNELASDILKASLTQQLPPMLQSPSMCKGCRHVSACSIYHKAHGGRTESSGLGDLFDVHTHHLSTAHCDFLRHWDRLIDLEAKEMQLVKKEIWSSHTSRSNNSAACLSSIVLETADKLPHKKSLKTNRFIYRFVRQDFCLSNEKESDVDADGAINSVNDLDCTLRSGDYVVLSSETRSLAIATGVITDINHFSVLVSFPKRLRLPGGSLLTETEDLLREVWRIDKDEFTTSFAVMRFNLVQLFLQGEQSSHLRKMIVDLEAPRFDGGSIFTQDPAISYVWSQKNLNNDQRQAILKILTARDYALILGMPGTGKTSTMVHAVKALLMRGASILLTSYTNSAVDNLLIKLKAQNISFIRIGRHEAVHEEVRDHCISGMDIRHVEGIKMRLEEVGVVAVTCLGITSPLLTSKTFDICIMDEAGQTTLPVCLGPLMFASKFILVGDHYQLPPLVQSIEARESGMGISLFCRLSEAHPQAISALQSQYRMCQGIMELSNSLIYGNRLRCGSPEIANAKLKFSSSRTSSLWLKEVLNPSKPVIFINTDMVPAHEAKDHKTVKNPIEAYIVAEVLMELLNRGIMEQDIGIITPYNSQANLIRQAVHSASVEVHTIDKYQGRDKDCIFLSFVRSSENARRWTSLLLGDWHRINVALTRAKKKLIMVGSRNTLSRAPLLKLLIEKVDEQSGILSVSKKDIHLSGGLKRCTQSR